ncbi:MAG TPA: Mov34/MPN/PAD-1 family protein [Gemmatimonadaceae bacterium]|nr:Mov34/MPN/PAD-1 family protein [Gemmatimonadaceae bacterium]
MRSNVLTLRKPIPLARAIRWVPAGLFTPPRTLDDLALFVTQSALREVMRHLRSNPEQELLGFLLGELYECPETGARYVVVNSAVRTGHAIAESDRILIPEEEWLGVQLEVRRRRTQLIGWYHSAPFVGPHPARSDLETHRALFTEPWQCGLVIATSGEAPTGAFFRSLMGERTGGGVLIPFYELPDDDEPIPADGRKRTLIDWVNYETRGTVERDESERRPFVPPRQPTPHGAPVILSVPSAPEEEDDDEATLESGEQDARGEAPRVIPLNALRPDRATPPQTAPQPQQPPPSPLARPPERGEPERPRPTTPPRGGSGLVMLPSTAELEELLAGPGPAERQGGGAGKALRYVLAALVVALVAYLYLWNSGRVALPGFLASVPVLDNAGAPAPDLGSADSENPPGTGNLAGNPSVPAPPATESAGATLSPDSPAVSPPSAAAGGATSASTENAPSPTSSTDPTVQRFVTMADSLEVSIRNFEDRNDDFTVKRIACDGLAVGYRAADDAFIALASAHRAARESLDSTGEARYRRLVDRMGRVNEEFGASGCPRP